MTILNKKLSNIIINLLKKAPSLRDNDKRLISNVLWMSCPKNLDKRQIFEWLASEAPSTESIRRTRQKLQELMPELRGKMYQARQEKQKEVKRELGY